MRVTRVNAPPIVIEDDAPDMSAERRAWLQAEVATCRRFLAELHPSKQLERLGFESRLSEAESELKAQESEWIYEDLKAMGR